MNTQKIQPVKQLGNTSGLSKKESGGHSTTQFVDNREEFAIQKRIQDNVDSSLSSERLNNTIQMMRTSQPSNIIQRACYSIMDGDHDSGNQTAGADFPGTIHDDYYHLQGNVQVHSAEVDRDEETNDLVSRQRQLTPIIGNIDHIVPANLGGGGIESNSRVLRADHNQARQDNFNSHNNNHPLAEVRLIHNGAEYTHAQTAIANGASSASITNLKQRWGTPWNPGGPLTDDRPGG